MEWIVEHSPEILAREEKGITTTNYCHTTSTNALLVKCKEFIYLYPCRTIAISDSGCCYIVSNSFSLLHQCQQCVVILSATVSAYYIKSFNYCQKLQFSASNVNSTSLGRALINVTKLHQLSVRANRITVVNENTLPWEFRRNLTFIDLAHNPFNCTCDLLWFRRSVSRRRLRGVADRVIDWLLNRVRNRARRNGWLHVLVWLTTIPKLKNETQDWPRCIGPTVYSSFQNINVYIW